MSYQAPNPPADNPYGASAFSAPTPTNRMLTLKSVDILSTGKIFGAIYAFLGLLIGGMFSLLALIGAAAGGGGQAAIGGLVSGLGAIIIMPLLYGVMGFIGGIIMGLIYNLCAKVVGGVRFEME